MYHQIPKSHEKKNVHLDLFDPVQNRAERHDLSQRINSLNHKYGLKTIALGVEGEKQQPWKVKSGLSRKSMGG